MSSFVGTGIAFGAGLLNLAQGVYELVADKGAALRAGRRDPVASGHWRRDGRTLVCSGVGLVLVAAATVTPATVATALWVVSLGLLTVAWWRDPWRAVIGGLYRDLRVLAWLVPTFFATLIGVLLLVFEPASNWPVGIALVGAGAVGFSMAVRSRRRHGPGFG